jgi:hypothetical protein
MFGWPVRWAGGWRARGVCRGFCYLMVNKVTDIARLPGAKYGSTTQRNRPNHGLIQAIPSAVCAWRRDSNGQPAARLGGASCHAERDRAGSTGVPAPADCAWAWEGSFRSPYGIPGRRRPAGAFCRSMVTPLPAPSRAPLFHRPRRCRRQGREVSGQGLEAALRWRGHRPQRIARIPHRSGRFHSAARRGYAIVGWSGSTSRSRLVCCNPDESRFAPAAQPDHIMPISFRDSLSGLKAIALGGEQLQY